MSRRAAAWLAWSLVALYVALLVGGTALSPAAVAEIWPLQILKPGSRTTPKRFADGEVRLAT